MCSGEVPGKLRGPVLGVGAIVVRETPHGLEVLLVKRRYPPFRGMWSFPGGHVEPGEPLLDAATRELEEETGLRGEPLGVVHIHELVADGPSGPTHYVIVDILFRYMGGEPRAASDAEEARFVELGEAQGYPLTPGARIVLRRIAKLYSGGCTITPERTVCLGEPLEKD